MSKALRTAITLAAAAMVGGSLDAQTTPTAVYSTFNATTRQVTAPIGGARNLTSFNGVYRSPNAQRWIIIGNIDGATTSDQVLIAGSGNTGAVIVQQGQAIPNLTTRTVNIIDNPRINDAGQFAFNCNTGGSGNPSLVFLFGSVTPAVSFNFVAGGGEAIPELPGSTYSGGYSATLLDNTGRYGFQTGLNDGTTTTPAIFFDGVVKAKTNDFVLGPLLLNGTPGMWTAFTLRRVFVNSAGNSVFAWGLGGSGEDIAALNNVAIIAENSPLILGGPNVLTFNSVWREPAGRWFVRGTLDDNMTDTARSDFIVSDGLTIAKRTEPVIPGSSLLWGRVNATSTSNGFLFNIGNNRGDYILAGWTFDGSARLPVAVLNGTTIVARGGDPIDANGDGLTNDDCFIQGFKQETGAGSAFLSDDGRLWMLVTARNAAGTNLGESLVRMQITLPPNCLADFNNDGTPTIDDLFIYLNAYFNSCTGQPGAPCNGLNADVGANGLSIDDLFLFINAYFSGCP